MKRYIPNKIVTFAICLIFTCCSGITDGLRHRPDIINPLIDYSITVDNFSKYSYTRDVVISINPGDADEIRFSNDNYNWSDWEPAVISKQWILTEKNSIKTVYAEFRRNSMTINSASDDIEFIEKLIPVSGLDYDSFGASVSVSADGATVIMGGVNYSKTNTLGFTYRPGGAIIYKYDGIRWNSVILTPDGASGNDRFGSSVSVSGDGKTVVIGSPGYSDNSGRLLVYSYNSVTGEWHLAESITGETESNFGNSVAISKNGAYIVCGAVAGNSNRGKAVLYSLSGLSVTKQYEFYADDGVAEDLFGCAVSINRDGSVIAVGAEQRKVSVYTNSGIIYIFRKTGSSFVCSEVSPASTEYNMHFGCSVAISGNGSVICVGAKGVLSENGAVYVLRYNGSAYTHHEIIDSESAAGDQFGYSVAISDNGNIFVAGSPYADKSDTDTGKLSRYVFDGYSYNSTGSFTYADPTYQKHLGISVSITDTSGICIGGAIKDIYQQILCGTSYVFRD